MPQMSKRLKGRSVLTMARRRRPEHLPMLAPLLWKHALLPMRSGSGCTERRGGGVECRD